jgi:hypothetical protein
MTKLQNKLSQCHGVVIGKIQETVAEDPYSPDVVWIHSLPYSSPTAECGEGSWDSTCNIPYFKIEYLVKLLAISPTPTALR